MVFGNAASAHPLIQVVTPMAQRRASRRQDAILKLPAEKRWPAFLANEGRSLSLSGGVVYSLPLRLIDALEFEAKGVLTDEQLNFERRLRTLFGTGIANGMPFYVPTLDVEHFESGDFSSTAAVNTDLAAYREIAARIVDRPAVDSVVPQNSVHVKLERAFTQSIEKIHKAYMGWLMTNSAFRSEYTHFVSENSRFVSGPPANMLARWEGATSQDLETPAIVLLESARRLQLLLKRWCLRSIIGFELPLPREIVGGFGEFGSSSLPERDDVVIRIPPAMANVRLDLSSVTVQLTSREGLQHLRQWFEGDGESGGLALARMVDLLIYLEHGLLVRYPSELNRKLARVERAIARFWAPSDADDQTIERMAETVRDTKKKLKRRLKDPASPPPSDGE